METYVWEELVQGIKDREEEMEEKDNIQVFGERGMPADPVQQSGGHVSCLLSSSCSLRGILLDGLSIASACPISLPRHAAHPEPIIGSSLRLCCQFCPASPSLLRALQLQYRAMPCLQLWWRPDPLQGCLSLGWGECWPKVIVCSLPLRRCLLPVLVKCCL
jgi:hypothetical protein